MLSRLLKSDPCKQGTVEIKTRDDKPDHTFGHACGVVCCLVMLGEGDEEEKGIWPQMKENIHFHSKEYGLYSVVWGKPLQVCGKGIQSKFVSRMEDTLEWGNPERAEHW